MNYPILFHHKEVTVDKREVGISQTGSDYQKKYWLHSDNFKVLIDIDKSKNTCIQKYDKGSEYNCKVKMDKNNSSFNVNCSKDEIHKSSDF